MARNKTPAKGDNIMTIKHNHISLVLGDEGREYIWAGSTGAPKRGDGTRVCSTLEARGVLIRHEVVDGYHAWEIAPEWVGRVRVVERQTAKAEETR